MEKSTNNTPGSFSANPDSFKISDVEVFFSSRHQKYKAILKIVANPNTGETWKYCGYGETEAKAVADVYGKLKSSDTELYK